MASSAVRAACISLCVVFLLGAVNGQDNFDIGEERKTHLHFFFHDIVSGPNATAIPILQSPAVNTSAAGFGLVVMIDNALTEGPNLTSKLIGRAQGFYAIASKESIALLMTMNFYFTDGVYNGSTLAVLARNSVASATREMSIVGGTGYFRFAQGYAIAKTASWNMTTGDATVEYDVYVIHRGPVSAQASSSSAGSGGAPAYLSVLLLLQAAYFLFFLGS